MKTRNRLAPVATTLCILGAASPPVTAQSAAGDMLVRVRAVHLDAANKDSTGLDLSINNRFIPEVDFTYFFSPQFSAELVLTYPQRQDVRADGTKVGTLKHLPPTLTGQYRFTGLGGVQPYVGAGLNYTRFSRVDLPAGLSLEKNSVGLALQAGADIPLSKGLLLNIDVKKVQIRTDVSSSGSKLGTLKIDPWLIGLGVGWKF